MAAMQTRELRELAISTTSLMSEAAAHGTSRLNSKTDKQRLLRKMVSEIMTRVLLVQMALGDPLVGSEGRIAGEFPRLLRRLEEVCTWPKVPLKYDPSFPSLHNLKRQSSRDGLVNTKLSQSIVGFAREDDKEKIEILFSTLDRFISLNPSSLHQQPSEIPDGKMLKELIESPDEYPANVHKLLHATLSQHSGCTCSNKTEPSASKGHWARLMLVAQVEEIQDHILFDMLFSGAPGSQCLKKPAWQQMRFQVPKESKSVRFAEDNREETQSPPQYPGGSEMEVIQSGTFCTLLRRRLGCACMQLKIVDGDLYKFHDLVKRDEMVVLTPARSVPLSSILKSSRLPPKAKLFLAYTLAKAVWRYYSSDFMKTPWTTGSVHFMREKKPKEINPAKPCLELRPSLSENSAPAEHHVKDVYHHYPRVLALGVLLVAICHDEPLPARDEASTIEEQMNNDIATCWNIVQCKSWPELGLQHSDASSTYRAVVEKCLDSDYFNIPSPTEGQGQAGIRHRRNALYTHVVLPLEVLCDNARIIGISDVGRLAYSEPNSTTTTDCNSKPQGSISTHHGLGDMVNVSEDGTVNTSKGDGNNFPGSIFNAPVTFCCGAREVT